MNKPFRNVGGLRPGRSVFDLSYSALFDCYAGNLIPVMCDEVVPGDVFHISNEVIVRLQPLIAPMMHAVNITVHYFFVPYRLLWADWEKFITGGEDGLDVSVLPRWAPGGVPVKGNLWDYLGFPLVNVAATDRPIVFPLRAYHFIWNEYYRDETLQTKIDFLSEVTGDYGILNRDWRKDYFTSALPWTQRGTAPALPVVGSAVWTNAKIVDNGGPWAPGTSGDLHTIVTAADARMFAASDTAGHSAQAAANYLAAFNANTLAATSVNISDLRVSVQVQKFLERNARAGVRYTEFLQEHFGVHPRDERLQRPEYIGGSKQPLIVSEVLKTSQDGSRPQGNLAGHGLSASMAKIASYRANEFGLIMGIMSITPEAVYASQGFDRQWLRRSRYDFPFPEFAHLSEQAIEREEIFATAIEADNRAIWGYQGRYDEMRVKRSRVMTNMRDTLNYWHMARTFAAAPALNSAFLTMNGYADPGDLTRVFAVHSEPGYIVHFGNKIVASRPIPEIGEPGLMDHF